MHPPARERVHTILAAPATDAGTPQGGEELLAILYDELRALARAALARERPGATLQATALVHEAWLRLADGSAAGWSGRAHFFGAAARAMQRILVDRARERAREKRGGAHRRVSLDENLTLADEPDGAELLALDEALVALAQSDARKAEVVRLRHFAGLELAEVAELLGLSLATVKSDWAFARAWLHRELARGSAEAGA